MSCRFREWHLIKLRYRVLTDAQRRQLQLFDQKSHTIVDFYQDAVSDKLYHINASDYFLITFYAMDLSGVVHERAFFEW